MEKSNIVGGRYLVGSFRAADPMTAIAITQAPSKAAAVRNCLRYDEEFLYEVFVGQFCDTIDTESVSAFFGEHTDWASLYMAMCERFPSEDMFASGGAVAAVAALPVDMLAHILAYGDVSEPTVLNLASLPAIAPQNEPPLPDDLWLLYEDFGKTTVDSSCKIVAALDEMTARRIYVELRLEDDEFLEDIAVGGPWQQMVVLRADADPSPDEMREIEDEAEMAFINDIRDFFADHTDWANLYLDYHKREEPSADVVASFPRAMLLHIYEADRGRWLFAVDLSTVPLIRE